MVLEGLGLLLLGRWSRLELDIAVARSEDIGRHGGGLVMCVRIVLLWGGYIWWWHR